MNDDGRVLPPDRLWQQTTGKWFAVIFGASLAPLFVKSKLEHDKKERERVEVHLTECEDCRADLHTLRWTKRLLRQARGAPAQSTARDGQGAR